MHLGSRGVSFWLPEPSNLHDGPLHFLYYACVGLSISLFLYYGTASLLADGMVAEFERFGLSRFRRMTGVLELLGALGLTVGLFLPAITVVSAGGLALLMALGVAVRVRVGDAALETLPAVVLGVVNLFILLSATGVVGS